MLTPAQSQGSVNVSGGEDSSHSQGQYLSLFFFSFTVYIQCYLCKFQVYSLVVIQSYTSQTQSRPHSPMARLC